MGSEFCVFEKIVKRKELYQVPSQITKETSQFLKLKRRFKKVEEILKPCTVFLNVEDQNKST